MSAWDWEEFCRLNNTPTDLRSATLDVNELMPEHRSRVGKRWLENPRKSLLLYGGTGTGKTYFMHALMRALIERLGLAVARFFKSKKLDDSLLAASLERPGGADDLMGQVKEIPFLFLDDFGMERSGERAEREYYDLIDERVSWKRPMIISTNLTDEKIKSEYGERIHSRLKVCMGIHFDGDDLRGRI